MRIPGQSNKFWNKQPGAIVITTTKGSAMKKLIIFLLIIVFLISGCSFDMQVVTPAPSQSNESVATQYSVTPLATVSAIPSTPIAGFTPVNSEPIFYGAYVSMDESEKSALPMFPTGTKQVFAHWNYQNMRAG